ncbi:unnamed protein product, partial [Callosobruchus maculatus]
MLLIVRGSHSLVGTLCIRCAVQYVTFRLERNGERDYSNLAKVDDMIMDFYFPHR